MSYLRHIFAIRFTHLLSQCINRICIVELTICSEYEIIGNDVKCLLSWSISYINGFDNNMIHYLPRNLCIELDDKIACFTIFHYPFVVLHVYVNMLNVPWVRNKIILYSHGEYMPAISQLSDVFILYYCNVDIDQWLFMRYL
jgi:hypothetical protein